MSSHYLLDPKINTYSDKCQIFTQVLIIGTMQSLQDEIESLQLSSSSSSDPSLTRWKFTMQSLQDANIHITMSSLQLQWWAHTPIPVLRSELADTTSTR